MTFKDTFPQQLKMNRLENTFKQLYRQFPERNLELPHSSEYLSDILRLAAQRTGSSFPTALMENRLEEDLFFRSGFDTEPVPPPALPPRQLALPLFSGGGLCHRRKLYQLY